MENNDIQNKDLAQATKDLAQAKLFNAQAAVSAAQVNAYPYLQVADVALKFLEFGWKVYDKLREREHEILKLQMQYDQQVITHNNNLELERFKWALHCKKEEKTTEELLRKTENEKILMILLEEMNQIREAYPLEESPASILHEYNMSLDLAKIFRNSDNDAKKSDDNDVKKSEISNSNNNLFLPPLILIAPPKSFNDREEYKQCEHPVIRQFRRNVESIPAKHKYRFRNIWKSGDYRGEKFTKALWYTFRYIPTLAFETQEDKENIYVYIARWDAGLEYNKNLLWEMPKDESNGSLNQVYELLAHQIAVVVRDFLNLYYLRDGVCPQIYNDKFEDKEYRIFEIERYLAYLPIIKNKFEALQYLLELIVQFKPHDLLTEEEFSIYKILRNLTNVEPEDHEPSRIYNAMLNLSSDQDKIKEILNAICEITQDKKLQKILK